MRRCQCSLEWCTLLLRYLRRRAEASGANTRLCWGNGGEGTHHRMEDKENLSRILSLVSSTQQFLYAKWMNEWMKMHKQNVTENILSWSASTALHVHNSISLLTPEMDPWPRPWQLMNRFWPVNVDTIQECGHNWTSSCQPYLRTWLSSGRTESLLTWSCKNVRLGILGHLGWDKYPGEWSCIEEEGLRNWILMTLFYLLGPEIH